MSKIRFLRAGVILFAFVLSAGLGVPAAFAQSQAAAPAALQEILWSDFVGAPTIPSGTNGLWIWSQEVDGQELLHLRVGSDGAAHTFTGTIKANRAGNFYDVALVNETGDDSVTQTKYNVLAFMLTTTGGGEGIDVNWSSTHLLLDLQVDGASVPAQIFYGAAGTAATGNPLSVGAGKDGLLTLPLTMLDGPTSFTKNIANGYFLYRDANGRFHLRVTTVSNDDVNLYRGTVRAEDGIVKTKHIFLGDPGDFVQRVTAKRLDFRFLTKGHVDGFDWIVGGAGKPKNMTFTLRMGDVPAAPSVSLGSNPFGTLKALTFRLTE